jgi:hypothetical protein
VLQVAGVDQQRRRLQLVDPHTGTLTVAADTSTGRRSRRRLEAGL